MSDNIDLSLTGWHSSFNNMSIMEECIPMKVLPSQRNLPWLNKTTKSTMRFKKSDYSAKFRSARNEVTRLLRRAKDS